MAQTPQRRQPRRFEPPPWEREQFERLEQERARAAETQRAERQEAPEPVAPATPHREPKPGITPPKPDEIGIDEMLMALKAEEPAAVEGAWRFGLIVAGFVGAVGLMLVIWGMVALARTAGSGPAGIMGAMIMSVMGGLFVGLAAWMGARSLKQRGVL